MDKVIKASAGLGILLVSSAVFYYFVFYLPRTNEERQQRLLETQITDEQGSDLKNQKKCREAGEKLYKKQLETASVSSALVSTPQYKFSKRLNTCLYYGGERKGDYGEKWIIDAYQISEPPVANTPKLAWLLESPSSSETDESKQARREKFQAEVNRLFSN